MSWVCDLTHPSWVPYIFLILAFYGTLCMVESQLSIEQFALGVKFDDNRSIDIFLFGKNDYEGGELSERDFFNYVNNHIVRKYQLEGFTNYAGVMKRIVKKYSLLMSCHG
ncbi:hypothetical protein POF51_01445 [Brevibacillus sp. AG]|uniref:hypothetical protein n=1 Tax=Brevibacillus sp. AG TaxID=3020891 RepID=UPI000852EE30|nr:hypothetical protein [Brevibacillus sp. AG]MDC0759349.1 hypothetical protein [Brevibacillus sp. AG]